MPLVNLARPSWSTRLHITLVPEISPSDPRAAIARSPKGTGGVYHVTFILAKPGQEYFRADLNYDALINSGDSLLLVPKGVACIKVEMFNEQESVEALFWPNSRGALAKGELRLAVSNFDEAQRSACNLIMPFLSWWSYRYDVAIDIAGYAITEENTAVTRYVFGCQGEEKMLVLDATDAKIASTPQYRALFAAYREAGNATNPFYQFLCYYRVTEGVCKLRTMRKKGRIDNQSYRELQEVIPVDLKVDDWWKDSFAPYLGRKFSWVLNERLRKLVRNAVAHLNPTSDNLVADRFEDVEECEKVIPVIKYIAREMLCNELTAEATITSSVM